MSEENAKHGKPPVAEPRNEAMVNRRDAFRGLAAAAADAAEDMTWMREVKNPYGGGPNTA